MKASGHGYKRVARGAGLLALLLLVALAAPATAAGPSGRVSIPVCTADGEQHAPAVSRRWIVWEDERGGYDDLYAFDTATGTTKRVTSAAGKESLPAADGDLAVWEDFRNGSTSNLYLRDLRTTVERLILYTGLGDRYNPDISGTRVVWVDTRSGNYDIYSYDTSSGVETPVCTEERGQFDPAVWGQRVVWQDTRESAGLWGDIYSYDYRTATESAVCTNPAIQESPDIFGDWVVWQDYRADEYDIYARNMATGMESAICTAPGDQTNPAIWGDWVVWQDDRNADSDVYALDLRTGTESVVTTAPGAQIYPAVANGWVAWKDAQGSLPADIRATRVTPVANDSFSAPRTLSGTKGSLVDYDLEASAQPGEPRHAWHTPNASLWYRWTAPAAGKLTLDLAGSAYDTVVAVYRGSRIASLTTVGYNDDYGTRTQSRLTVSVTARTTYMIAVDAGTAGRGIARLAWSLYVPPKALLTQVVPRTVYRNRLFTVTGTLKPRHTSGSRAVTVQCLRLENKKWVLRRSYRVPVYNITGGSRFSARLALPYAGRWRIRAYHADAGHSPSYSAYSERYVR